MEDVKINVKIKLAGLWTSMMFLYIYADIKALFETGIIEQIMAGEIGGAARAQVAEGITLVFGGHCNRLDPS